MQVVCDHVDNSVFEVAVQEPVAKDVRRNQVKDVGIDARVEIFGPLNRKLSSIQPVEVQVESCAVVVREVHNPTLTCEPLWLHGCTEEVGRSTDELFVDIVGCRWRPHFNDHRRGGKAIQISQYSDDPPNRAIRAYLRKLACADVLLGTRFASAILSSSVWGVVESCKGVFSVQSSIRRIDEKKDRSTCSGRCI